MFVNAVRNADGTVSIMFGNAFPMTLTDQEAREVYRLIDREHAREDAISVLSNEIAWLEDQRDKYPKSFDESDYAQLNGYKKYLDDSDMIERITTCYMDDYRGEDDDAWRYGIKEAIRSVGKWDEQNG